MKFYIATSLLNAEAHNQLRDILVKGGHEITYDWTAHGSLQGQGTRVFRQKVLAEIEGVRSCDVLVTILPGGKGTHVELGIAIGSHKPIIILGTNQDFDAERTPAPGEHYTCLFYWSPGVYWATNHEEVLYFMNHLASQR